LYKTFGSLKSMTAISC